MGEYHCYEFVALERPLTPKQMAALRALSTRAEISPTRFWNEYHWGDLKADPKKLMERHFDAHLHFSSLGERRLMLRLPKGRIAEKALEPYVRGGHAGQLTSVGGHILVDLCSDTEQPEYDEQNPSSLATLAPLRAELMRGDMRPAYLMWLLALSEDDIDDDAADPPIPGGLAELTSAHVDEPDLALGFELLGAFRATLESERSAAPRTVGALRALAESHRVKRKKAEAARAARAKAATDRARRQHLIKLVRDIDGAWARLEKLIEASRYDEAVTLSIDLRDAAAVHGPATGFAQRFEVMRKRQLRRRGFFVRWKRATEAGD